MRSGAKVAIAGGVFVVVAGGVAYGGYTLVGGDGGSGSTQSRTQNAPARTGPLSADEIKETSTAFLQAWAKGDTAAAGALTNNQSVAATALTGYRDDAHITDVVVTPGTPSGAVVPYTVKAQVSFEGKTAPLSYASQLTVVRGQSTFKPLVDWQPAVLHPQLKAGEHLVTGGAANPEIEAVDYKDRPLTKEKYPSLGAILDGLREKYGAKVNGTAGIELQIKGANTPARTLITLQKGSPGKLKTTLDADVQAAAENAVKRFGESSVVAVKPSTGEIRAVADNRTDAFPASLQGRVAPGSTMKIVTAAMLIEKGQVSADQPAECPSSVVWQGVTFHNLDNFSLTDQPFSKSFAKSCNTAFIKKVDDVKDNGALGRVASSYFGIGQDWKVGVPSFDGSVPASEGAETAAAYIGQGKVQMSPLDMASIAATAQSGRFRQPVIVPQSLDGRALAQASPLPAGIDAQLRKMMHLTATASYGTATQAMSGVHGDKGAKTGSAEKDGQNKSDSWFAAYSDDLAAAGLVQSGGHGGDAAGPIVAQVLRAG
ncbi:penicillin-binding transpeptidase domain-containing protein [Streptomyces sp. NBC_00083]|uniref:penicillin-binding transpeptidase domain-containing protein n=1 Tax=Streptomyces sp. NBC_00083 TaxID=2975647 RepID=UPI0022500C6C|nr:penicillin-binding transpeptidase domain-containing protein [Streptomyces sp. NBC_00083]MCX5381946.1 penicillin-binding transpeptidase domain-containing protein [Streptomyces sp. NBC_00083]